MSTPKQFDRCVYCFAKKEADAPCPVCGYAWELTDPPGWWLLPGTVLKNRYVVGRHQATQDTALIYLGWDEAKERLVDIVEYFPGTLVTRDITTSDKLNCIPGKEAQLEAGKQAFFEKAKLYYRCVSRVEPLDMDFLVRNETCYYIRLPKKK